MSEPGFREMASQLWKFLDDLAEKDPEEYRRFIVQQAKAVSQQTPTPQGSPLMTQLANIATPEEEKPEKKRKLIEELN